MVEWLPGCAHVPRSVEVQAQTDRRRVETRRQLNYEAQVIRADAENLRDALRHLKLCPTPDIRSDGGCWDESTEDLDQASGGDGNTTGISSAPKELAEVCQQVDALRAETNLLYCAARRWEERTDHVWGTTRGVNYMPSDLRDSWDQVLEKWEKIQGTVNAAGREKEGREKDANKARQLASDAAEEQLKISKEKHTAIESANAATTQEDKNLAGVKAAAAAEAEKAAAKETERATSASKAAEADLQVASHKVTLMDSLLSEMKPFSDSVELFKQDAEHYLPKAPGVCQELRMARGDQAYVIIFDEENRTFDYPWNKVLYEDMDVILCVEENDRAYRYLVNVGSTSKGGDGEANGFSDTVSTDLSIALQRGGPSVNTGRDCWRVVDDAVRADAPAQEESWKANAKKTSRSGSSPQPSLPEFTYLQNKGDYDAIWTTCIALKSPVDDLVETISLVSSITGRAARSLVKNSDEKQDDRSLDEISKAEMPVCKAELARRSAPSGDMPMYLLDLFEADNNRIKGDEFKDVWSGECSSSAPEDLHPIEAILNRSTYSWVAGRIVFPVDFNTEIVNNNEELKKLNELRDSLADDMIRTVAAYQRIAALAADYVKYGHRRQTIFNLGRYSANTLISGSMTARALVFNFDEAGTSLVRQVSSNTYAFSTVVHKATWWGIQPGYLLSAMPATEYQLVAGTTTDSDAESATINDVIQTKSSRFRSPVLFANFYLCPQDVRSSEWERRCKDDQDSIRRYLPSVAFGVPMSKELGEGHVFVGVGLPYVPDLTITLGAHIGNTRYVGRSILESGTVSTSLDQVAYDRIAIAPFLSINASAEILGQLFPALKPAN